MLGHSLNDPDAVTDISFTRAVTTPSLFPNVPVTAVWLLCLQASNKSTRLVGIPSRRGVSVDELSSRTKDFGTGLFGTSGFLQNFADRYFPDMEVNQRMDNYGNKAGHSSRTSGQAKYQKMARNSENKQRWEQHTRKEGQCRQSEIESTIPFTKP